MKQPFRRTLSLILSMTMLLSTTGMNTVFAARGGQIQGGEITAFAPLSEGVEHKTAIQGTKKQDLPLPNTLTATVSRTVPLPPEDGQDQQPASPGNADTGITETTTVTDEIKLPVTWICDDYDPVADPGTAFAFVPQWDTDKFPLGDGVEAPEITVTLTEQRMLFGGQRNVTTTTATNANALKTALEATDTAVINVEADITMDQNITVKADHVLNIAADKTVYTGGNTLTIPTGKTLALGGTGTLKANNNNSDIAIYVNGGTLTQGTGSKLHAANSGGGTSVNLWKGELVSTGTILVENSGISSTGITVDESSLTLTDTTLTVKNSGGTTGVWVWDYGSLTLNNSTIILENAAGDGLYFGGITELIMDATSVIDVRAVMDGIGVQFLSGTTRTITDGAKIILAQGAKLNNAQNCFNDRGIGFDAGGEVTVGAAGAQPSYRILTAGDYAWNGQYFAKARGAVTYNVTVIDGILASLSSAAAPGDTVILNALPTAERVFKEWSITPEVTFIEGTSKYSNMAKFEMPNHDVVATATYGPFPTGITLNQSSLSLYSNAAPDTATLTSTTLPADTINIPVEWTSDNTRVASVDQNGKVTAHANGTAIITATTKYGGFTASCTVTVSTYSSSSGDSGGSTTTGQPNPNPATNPTTNAETKVPGNVDANGNATVTIPEKSVTDAIKAAQDEAKKSGTTANGIAVTVNVTTDQAASSIAATLSQNAINELVKAGVTQLRIESRTANITLDLTTLKQIQAMGGDPVTISASAVQPGSLSAEAQAVIGSRPVFDLSITADGKAVTGFNGGSVSVALPYTPAADEKTGNLYGVYVNGEGKVTYLTDSSYDANAGMLRFRTSHFSIFGIGYKTDAPGFTDTANHWAKESIDFAVGRGLLGGTDTTAFSPDTGMTRGMFVLALGRLANIDSTKYKNTRFTDVAADASYAPYTAWALEAGITDGTGETTFAPDQIITRQDLAVFMQNYARAMGDTLPKTRETITYADSTNIGSFARDAVRTMQMAGVMNGKNENNFDPTAPATRVQAAAVLHRYVELTIDIQTSQGLDVNDSGSAIMYENGKQVKSASRTVNGNTYNFNANGEAALPTMANQ